MVKLFMGSSTGGMLVDDDRALAALFAEFGGVIAAHCEDEKIIRTNTDIYRHRFGDGATAAIHPLVRSAEACYASTARAVELADRYGTRLHVCHLSTARELALFELKNLTEKRITAEACVPHLWFSDEDYAAPYRAAGGKMGAVSRTAGGKTVLGNLIKCNPAIKTAAGRAALREALGGSSGTGAWARSMDAGAFLAGADAGSMDAGAFTTEAGTFRTGAGGHGGKIDIIATDHAPHTAAEKSRGYWDAPSGIPSVQHSLPVMFTLAAQGVVTLETLVEKMCHAPAVRFGIARRGFLRTGYKADITIVDPAAEWTVAPENILSKCGWSPWEGVRLSARVVCTIVGGHIAWDGERVSSEAAGERLTFE